MLLNTPCSHHCDIPSLSGVVCFTLQGEEYVNSRTLTDVTFHVEGRPFYAHRIALLASSEAFRAMFGQVRARGEPGRDSAALLLQTSELGPRRECCLLLSVAPSGGGRSVTCASCVTASSSCPAWCHSRHVSTATLTCYPTAAVVCRSAPRAGVP